MDAFQSLSDLQILIAFICVIESLLMFKRNYQFKNRQNEIISIDRQ